MADAKAAALETDAEVEDGAEGAAGQPKKKFALKLPPLKFLLIGGAAVLLLAGAGAGAGGYFFFFRPAEHKVETPAVKPVVFVDLPDILVNLSNPGADRTQYLKVKVVLELPEQKMIEQITP